jgi:predicted RND superfamily exporter protein
MWSARHRKAVALGWVLIVVLGLAGCSVISANTNLEEKAPGEAGKASSLFDERFGVTQGELREIIVFSHPSLTVDDPIYRQTVQGLMENLRALRVEGTRSASGTTVVSSARIVSGATTYYDVGAPREASPFVAPNKAGGDVSFALVSLVGNRQVAQDNIDPVLQAVKQAQADSPDFQILEGGDASINKERSTIVQEDFGFALFLNLPVTLVILIIAFGALAAAFVPLALALAAVITATGILAVISHGYPLADVYTEIVLLMGWPPASIMRCSSSPAFGGSGGPAGPRMRRS